VPIFWREPVCRKTIDKMHCKARAGELNFAKMVSMQAISEQEKTG